MTDPKEYPIAYQSAMMMIDICRRVEIGIRIDKLREASDGEKESTN